VFVPSGVADAPAAGLPVHVRNGRLQKREKGFAAAGGDPIFFSFADGRRELQQASQRSYQRRRPLIFESAMPIGTKTITDKNLPSCSVAS
jgi:hypothetical protein